MQLHRLEGDEEGLRDLAVAHALRGELSHAALGRGDGASRCGGGRHRYSSAPPPE